MSKSKVKAVRAWAVVYPDDGVIDTYYDTELIGTEIPFKAIFPTKEAAKDFNSYGEPQNIVQVSITPITKKKKR